MDVKVGDRISIDGTKVGQIRRTGKVLEITEGLSGTRLLVRWDDGHQTSFSPAGGNLIIESRARLRSNGRAASKSAAKKPKAAAKKPKAAAKKPKAAAKRPKAKPAAKKKAAAKSRTKR